MPEITLLGWFHTIVGITALVTGFYTLVKFSVINLDTVTGKIYLACTLVAAATALMIFQHGKFGAAHMLAVLTLVALAGGFLVTKIGFLSKIAPYFQAWCYTATLLFHMIPAITDATLRLPVGDPFLTSPHDPLLKQFFLAFLIIFLVGYAFQFRWIKKQNAQ